MDRFVPADEGAGSRTLSRLELAGSLQRSWPPDASWTAGNVDGVLPLIRLGEGAARTYVGTGLHLGRLELDGGGSDTRLGLNLIGGLRFEQRFLAPRFEVRGSVGGIDQLSAVIGVQLVGGGS